MIFLSKDAAGDKLVNFAKSLKTDNAKTLATTHLQEAQTLTLKKLCKFLFGDSSWPANRSNDYDAIIRA